MKVMAIGTLKPLSQEQRQKYLPKTGGPFKPEFGLSGQFYRWTKSTPLLQLRRLQVTLSAAKIGARVGAVHERSVPMESASAFIDQKIKELGDWRGNTLAKV